MDSRVSHSRQMRSEPSLNNFDRQRELLNVDGPNRKALNLQIRLFILNYTQIVFKCLISKTENEKLEALNHKKCAMIINKLRDLMNAYAKDEIFHSGDCDRLCSQYLEIGYCWLRSNEHYAIDETTKSILNLINNVLVEKREYIIKIHNYHNECLEYDCFEEIIQSVMEFKLKYAQIIYFHDKNVPNLFARILWELAYCYIPSNQLAYDILDFILLFLKKTNHDCDFISFNIIAGFFRRSITINLNNNIIAQHDFDIPFFEKLLKIVKYYVISKDRKNFTRFKCENVENDDFRKIINKFYTKYSQTTLNSEIKELMKLLVFRSFNKKIDRRTILKLL